MKLFHREIKGPGEPLVILHGLFGMSDNWQSFARSAAASRHIVLVDQRNHGRSPHSQEFSYPAMAQDLLELMDDLHLKHADLLGHSMGGKTVMELATLHPDRVGHLVVADIGPKAYPLHHEYLIEAMESLPLSQFKSRQEAEKLLEGKIVDAGVRQFLLKNLYWEEDSTLAWRFNLKVIKARLEEVGKPLPADRVFEGPTLFLRGGKSHYILDEDLLGLRDHFPRAVVQTIPNAGHWLHAEQPEAFYRAVVEFLDV
jgi:pimeloyl-ACP methyl ester carboxylesterase